jgi:hypothetical protein
MTRYKVPVLAMALSVFSVAGPAQGQETINVQKIVTFAVPSSPALQFIGASPAKIERPSSGPEIFTSLLSAIDTAGRVQQGFALDLAPAQFVWRTMDAAEYASTGGFILANTTLSTGTARASGDSGSTMVGFGVRTVFLDYSDPLSRSASEAGDKALWDAMNTCLRGGRPEGPERPVPAGEVKDVRSCLARADSTFRAEYRRLHWNDFALSAGLATGFGLKNSEWKGRESLGYAAWIAGAAPLCLQVRPAGICNGGQWIAQVHRERRDSTFDGAGHDRTAAGVRVVWGSGVFNVFAEGSQLWVHDAPEDADESYTEWSGGLEFRLAEDMWVATGFGGRFNDATQESDVSVIANLRFNVAPTRMLKQIVTGPPQALRTGEDVLVGTR